MGRRRDETDRVLGPTFIPSKAGASRWRVVVISPKETREDRRRLTRWFTTEVDAQEVCDQVAAGISRRNATTLDGAIRDYEQHLAEKGTGEKSRAETCRRLRLFFPELDRQVTRVSPEDAEYYYEAFRKRLKSDGEPISVDYHRSTLINARSMFKWLLKRGLVGANPFALVEGIGRRSKGKAQHTGDEARRFYRYCLARAKAGDVNALASLMALLMGLRSADLCRRIVRDVDMDGTVLRVYDGKTKMSNRPRHIPIALQPMVAKIVKGRAPGEPLFPTPYTDDGHHTRRWLEQAVEKLCAAAGVPRVVPHALKGTAGTVLAETGELADRIADHLSHEDAATTRGHYVDDAALRGARTARGAAAIMGPISGTKSGTRNRKRRAK